MTQDPVSFFIDWLAARPKDARVAVAVDPDRLVSASGLFLGRNAVNDKTGRQWQVAVFRGDDLAFRLRFRKATAAGPTVIVLTRGEGTDGKIDVSHVADILSKNEGGDPLDLSLPAFCRRLCPKINCNCLAPLQRNPSKRTQKVRARVSPRARATCARLLGCEDEVARAFSRNSVLNLPRDGRHAIRAGSSG